MALTQKTPRLTYGQLLQAVRQLSPADQRRLRSELVKMGGVYLARPSDSAAAIRRGRRLAEAVQAALKTRVSGSLDETMRQLRGCSWSC